MKQKFKVGDKVRRTTSSYWPDEYGHLGEIYTVFATELEGSLVVVTKGGSTTSSCNFILVEEPQVTHKFKVGDRVRRAKHKSTRFGPSGIEEDVVTGLSDCGHVYLKDSFWQYPDEIDLIEEKPMVDTSNPNKTPWGKMTPEEKGALLLAHYEGKTIQYWSFVSDIWFDTVGNKPSWVTNLEYRVKPKEPVVETVEVFSVLGKCFSDDKQDNDQYKITYQMVDGEPDWSTLKGETL